MGLRPCADDAAGGGPGVMRLARARQVLRDAIDTRVFPGAVVELGHADEAAATIAEGQLTYDRDGAPVTAETVYDLASLTKVLAGATLAAMLTGRERIHLEDRVGRWIPAWTGADREHVTLLQLLDHSSGLPAHRRYWESLQGRQSFVDAICREPLEYAPGTRSVYSDPGFILLGAALEAAGESSLEAQFDQWRARQLGSDVPVRFLPPAAWRDRIAPTEMDPWRGRVLRGDVHDENAAALGGVAAHAGLFGTAAAVGACARWWLRLVRDQSPRTDEDAGLADVARRFVRRTGVPGSSRGVGWDTMLPTSSCGSRMSGAAFGHTGFTGTSLWVDPHDRQGVRPGGLYVVCLANRVHPSRAGDGMTRVRQALHDAVAEDLMRV